MTAFRFSTAMLVCGISVSLLQAQQAAPRENGAAAPAGRSANPARPAAQQPRVERPQPRLNSPQGVVPAAAVLPLPPLDDPKLKKILDDWGNNSAEIRELRGTHDRYVFDPVFMTEKRSKGHFYYQAPDKGRIDLQPVPIAKDAAPRKPGYKLQSDRAERWICDGFQIITIDDEAKTYERFPLRPEMRGQNIINGPLPFLFGLKAAEAHDRFKMTLIPTKDPTVVVIVAVPRRKEDQANYSEARIILDTKANLPKAVRLLDPAESRVTEYFFDNLQPNGAGLRQAVEKMFGRDPFHPSVAGYTTVENPRAGEAQPREGAAPAPRNAARPLDSRGKAKLE